MQRSVVNATLYLLLSLLLLAALAIQFGALGGRQPTDIGVNNGRLKPPSLTPNSVSSQASLYPDHPQRAYAEIQPLALKQTTGTAAIGALAEMLGTMPGIRIVEQRPDYVRAEAETRWMKFTDDLEFWFNPARKVIELRSASRLGRRDFGVNRERIEAIRATYQARP